MERFQFSTEELAFTERSRIPFAIYQFVDKRVVTVALSDGFLELGGYGSDRERARYDMDNDMYRDLHPDDAARVAEESLHFALEGDAYDVVYRRKKNNGSGYDIIHAKGEHFETPTGVRLAIIWYTNEGAYDPEGKENGSMLSCSLTRTLYEESFVRANRYDSLTGLPNMGYFFELAKAGKKTMLDAGRQPTILFFDLSGMKHYNSQYGFAEGDKLLRSFAKLLSRLFGNENCGRMSNDHYAVYADATVLTEKLRELFDAAEGLNDGLSLPVRAGIVQVNKEDDDISLACDRAKMACDSIRETHASSYKFFTESLRAELDMRHYITDNIDRAIEEGWIKVYYQPIVRAVNGRVCDEEALARWIDPKRGFLSPGEFIPYLEDARLIYKLDLRILELVLEKLKVQRDAGLHLVPQSINLSRTDFDSCDVVEEIRERVDAAEIDHGLITIEITESIIGGDFEFMRTQIERFQSMGFPVWMDDFGSGYSSLDVLQSIKFDLLKFDMRFLRNFETDAAGKTILTELTKMATALGVDTVCEGVETEEQVRFLREIGCSKLQGYYYTPPIPLERVLERYEKGIQIGFEDPQEAAYYEAIGHVNLYDLASLTRGFTIAGESAFDNIFDTLPMAILEYRDNMVRFVRSNPSYRSFSARIYGRELDETSDCIPMDFFSSTKLSTMIRQCCGEQGRSFIDERFPDGSMGHFYARRVSVNPVTDAVAIVVAVLSMSDSNDGASYAAIAHALAADYSNIFYVDIETEQFIVYSSPMGEERLVTERRGENFFAQSRHDALEIIYPDDQDGFIAAFTKERVLGDIEARGTFVQTYRHYNNGNPLYMSMKATRLSPDSKYLIIGVSNVDAQVRAQKTVSDLQRERVGYSRVMALAGNFICLYVIDPATGAFTEYNATSAYASYDLPKDGPDFFGETRGSNALSAVLPADMDLYLSAFTKENVMREIERTGTFELRYHIVLDGETLPIVLRAALVKESDGDKLVLGIIQTGSGEER